MLSSLGKTTGVDPEAFSQIRQTLDDPAERLREELYWLHSSPDVVDPKIDLTSHAQVSGAAARLRAAAGRGIGRDQAIALHDLAVITYAHDVEEGLSLDESTALGLWAEVWASDEFWRYVGERAADARDARLTESFIAGLRQDIPARVLAPVSDRAASFLDEEDIEGAARAVRALRRSGMPERDVDAAARRAVSPLRARVEGGIEEVARLRATLIASDGDSPGNRAAFRAIRLALVSGVLASYDRLRRVDPFGDPGLADRVANEVRGVGISAFNVLNDWDTSYLLAREALNLARTPEALGALARDQATVARTYHQDRADRETVAKRNARAAAHFELAADYAEDESGREHLLSVARGAMLQAKLAPDAVTSAKQAISDELARQLEAFEEEIERTSTRGLAEPTVEEPPERPFAAAAARRPAARPGLRPASSRRWIVAALAVVLLCGVGVWYATLRGSGGSRPSTASASAVTTSSAQQSTPSTRTDPSAPTQQTSAECAELDFLEASLTALRGQIRKARRAVRDIDARNARVIATWESFLEQHPEQSLSSSDYATYVRLRRDVRTYEKNRKDLVRAANSLISSYNSKLRRQGQLARNC